MLHLTEGGVPVIKSPPPKKKIFLQNFRKIQKGVGNEGLRAYGIFKRNT